MGTFPLNLSKHQVILVHATLFGPERPHIIPLILDTGATYTMISPEILLRIGCDPSQAPEKKPITTASGIEYVPFLVVPAIQVFGLKVENLKVCVHSLPSNIPARGLLGLNFLKNFNTHLNFLKNQIEIFEK